jgi:hypothetical protein
VVEHRGDAIGRQLANAGCDVLAAIVDRNRVELAQAVLAVAA